MAPPVSPGHQDAKYKAGLQPGVCTGHDEGTEGDPGGGPEPCSHALSVTARQRRRHCRGRHLLLARTARVPHTGIVAPLAPPALLVRIDRSQLTHDGLAWADRAEVGDLLPGTVVGVYDTPSGNIGTATVGYLSRDYVYLQVDWGSLRSGAVSTEDEPPEWMVGMFSLAFRGLGAVARGLGKLALILLVVAWRLTVMGLRLAVKVAWCHRRGHAPGGEEGLAAGLGRCRRCGDLYQENAPTYSIAR